MNQWDIRTGDCFEVLRQIPSESVQCCVTSPPYFGLRDYGNDGQIGLEGTPELYAQKLVGVFREVRRVLKDDGTLWLNLGDSYGTGTTASRVKGNRGIGDNTQDAQDAVPRIGGMAKQLFGIPWRVAFALQADGWYLRSDIIWHKVNPMPESVTDRPTKAHEYIFLFSKSPKYYYDIEAIKEPVAESTVGRGPVSFGGKKGREYTPDEHDPNFRNGSEQWGRVYEYTEGLRNKRTVWTLASEPFSEAHFATFPTKLVEPCILAGCPQGGTVLDPFNGAGTTGLVALRYNRNYLGIELNPEYVEMSKRRIYEDAPLLNMQST